MLVKVEGGTQTPPNANEHKEGDDFDVCPVHGGEEVPALHRIGYGVDNRREEYMDGAIFSSDARSGGCGDTWSRTTATGADRLHNQGRTAAQLTRGAQRSIHLPPQSDAYADGYRRAFGHD